MSFRKLPLVRVQLDGRALPLRVYEAQGFLSRARGLLGSAQLGDDEALWIQPCNAVHTLGMRHAIDVVFLDRRQRVIAVRQALEPYFTTARLREIHDATHPAKMHRATETRRESPSAESILAELEAEDDSDAGAGIST